MDNVFVRYVKEPKLVNPVLIEGLPGVGNVGKLAADHLIDETGAEKIAEIYSKHFPPQVLVEDTGVIRQVNNELYYLKNPDILILAGDYQGLTSEGQYELADVVLNMAEKFGVKKIFTLGGYGLGRMIKRHRVLGAATNRHLVKEMKKYDVVFPKGEPGSGIIGAAGLLLGIGMLRGMDGVCLMGETSGYFVDPKAARAVLEVLTKVLRIKIDFSKLDEKAAAIERLASKMKEMEKQEVKRRRDDLGYIG
ncbi:MAG: proteasome assembly chaperone family protein [Candidatus Thermoplasmatota archaeon]|nr:proteasome assembly chaperone family protein [archaeon]MBU4189489.1 proteasome assembly chaperone family protein [Candidatus Thermoplasmatota archaeon]